MRKQIVVLAAFTVMVLPFAAQAAQKTSAVFSPKCSAKQLEKIAGEALVKIGPSPANNPKIFNVTLDTSKMTFAQLSRKMIEAKCY